MKSAKPVIAALQRQHTPYVPIWLMRQAGRYLPEYRELRAQARSFLDLCFTPDLAVEVTLQPIRRFPLDAAIIFSDILVVPYGLGQPVSFEEGQGPRLEPIRSGEQLGKLSMDRLATTLAPVATALAAVRRELPEHVALFGFAGAPWTVASYMVEGNGGTDFAIVKTWSYRQPESFSCLIDLLVDATTAYLLQQIEAGAEILQIFDSWAGVLSPAGLKRWALQPTAEIVRRVKARHPGIPIVAFPRGIGASYARYAAECGCDGLSLDTAVAPEWAAAALQPRVTVQGNLDPHVLVSGGDAMRDEATRILDRLAGGPFVFNLGHGILPQTPPDHVAALCELVHDWKRQ